MSDEIVLLEFWPSPFSTRVKIALEEKGIANYESRQEDFKSKSTLLLTMNPVHKKIPVLIHNGKPICESLTIIEYIDEQWKHNSPVLLPADPYHRAQARFWADFNDKMDIKKGTKLRKMQFFHTLRKVWRQKGGANEEDKKEFIDFLRKLEAELGDKPYFGGDTFGYLDVVLIPDYSWFYAFEKCTQVSIEAECPTLVAWAKRCMERDGVKTCLPDQFRIHDYVLELKKRFGND